MSKRITLALLIVFLAIVGLAFLTFITSQNTSTKKLDNNFGYTLNNPDNNYIMLMTFGDQHEGDMVVFHSEIKNYLYDTTEINDHFQYKVDEQKIRIEFENNYNDFDKTANGEFADEQLIINGDKDAAIKLKKTTEEEWEQMKKSYQETIEKKNNKLSENEEKMKYVDKIEKIDERIDREKEGRSYLLSDIKNIKKEMQENLDKVEKTIDEVENSDKVSVTTNCRENGVYCTLEDSQKQAKQTYEDAKVKLNHKDDTVDLISDLKDKKEKIIENQGFEQEETSEGISLKEKIDDEFESIKDAYDKINQLIDDFKEEYIK